MTRSTWIALPSSFALGGILLTALLSAYQPVVTHASGAQTTSAQCEALGAVALPNAKITKAERVEAGAFVPPPLPAAPPAKVDYTTLPAFCRVAATASPTPDSAIKLWHGWTDGLIPAQNTIDYYEKVLATIGAERVKDSVRLFMAPGVDHCAGGEGTFQIDALAAIDAWVESGKAPEQLVASRPLPGGARRTRPLCPYPQVARYRGQGSTDEASNFACEPVALAPALAAGQTGTQPVQYRSPEGVEVQARKWFERSVQSGGWPAFGFIVSEAELKRLR